MYPVIYCEVSLCPGLKENSHVRRRAQDRLAPERRGGIWAYSSFLANLEDSLMDFYEFSFKGIVENRKQNWYISFISIFMILPSAVRMEAILEHFTDEYASSFTTGRLYVARVRRYKLSQEFMGIVCDQRLVCAVQSIFRGIRICTILPHLSYMKR